MSLNQIQEKHQTKVFTKYFAFFAFSKKQLDEQINKNFKYITLGSGLCVPEIFATKIMSKLEKVYKNAIAEHKRTTSKKDIIWYELGNREAQITGSITDTFEALQGYGYTKADILSEYAEYYDYCVDNDYF